MLDDAERVSKILGIASNVIELRKESDNGDIDHVHSYACEVMNYMESFCNTTYHSHHSLQNN